MVPKKLTKYLLYKFQEKQKITLNLYTFVDIHVFADLVDCSKSNCPLINLKFDKFNVG